MQRSFRAPTAVAIALTSILALSGCNQTAPSTAPSNNEAASEATSEQPVTSQEVTASAEPDSSKISNYNETQAYSDGLTVTEFANSCGFDNLQQAYQYAGDDLGSRLETCIEQMGYNVTNSGMRTTSSGILCATSLTSFELPDRDDKFVQMQVLAEIENNQFNIQMSLFPFDKDTDRTLEIETDTVPIPDGALQIWQNEA